MGGCIFLLKYSTFSSMSLIKPFAPCLYNPIKRYCSSQESKGNHHNRHGMEERAPSTAEEFKRAAEQKLREAEQGVASQVSDKACDGTEEATLGEANLEKVEKRYMEHEDNDHDDHK
ncbi:hypothetical protein L484_012467 [Morus notabilis]|uniref:Uncharacterized protein n=1 Tax=Morus notabilis TaxID=981085 RepID=W9RP76_9ROSA|nr:uncharacterized protein LOC21395680 [Morus notabilis]EXB63277.1 hypothetical protein L484_012467 [Morus notabilis]